MPMMTAARAAFALTLTAWLGGCATSPAVLNASPQDPYEKFNRGVYKFNDALDRGVAKPVAKGYRAIAPQPVRTGVSNFIANLEMPRTFINDLLQGKVHASVSDLGRLVLNTTMGIGGIFDVASKAGIDHNEEDFGQTLGAWGVPAGPFLMIPLLGPSTARDAPSRVVDIFTDPAHYANTEARWGYTAVSLVNTRYQLLPLEPTLQKTFDPYAFVRNAYLQNRAYKVSDGKVSDEPLEDPEPEVDAAPDSGATKPK